MRKVILFNMTTMDGFFADPNGAIDWHVVDEEFHAFAIQQLDSVNTILFGRATYQLMASYWPTEAAVKRDPLIAGKMNETAKIVFSTTLERAEWANSRLVKEKAAEEVAGLKQQPGKEMIIFGSANLAATLAQNGLIDEYRMMVVPIVLGRGRPLFQGVKGRLPMKLLNTKVFRSGNVLLAYQPK
ncbi:MAG: dihydrofolate reductase family protein [Terriglobales bacterium]